jgi:ribosomal protein S18 acetylase RimI-like enzyme
LGGGAALRVPEHRLYDVDPENASHVAAAGRLHARLFADIGLIAKLGERMLRRVCYGVLIRDGLMGAAIFEVDGCPAGLAAYTADSKKVHEAPTRRYLWMVARESLVSIVLQPRIVLGLPGAARLLLARGHERIEGDTPVAEMLALGVLPAYRSPEFVRQTGLRVADRLLARGLDYFRQAGFREARGVVLADNLPALAFFRMRASRIEPYLDADKKSYQVWFDVEKLPGQRSPDEPSQPI